MIDGQEISINLIVLTIIYSMIQHFPPLRQYSDDVRFNTYRSIMCITFSLMGSNILVNNFTNGFAHPFSYQNSNMNEISHIFVSYIIIDLVKMAASNYNRLDLYIHHIWCLISALISMQLDKFGYLASILLICESISIITGIDSMAMEDMANNPKNKKISLMDNEYISYKCKKFRKYIIKYVRLPMWIIMFLFTIRFTNKSHPLIWYNGIILSCIMIYLDKYWEDKCDKVIDKYE